MRINKTDIDSLSCYITTLLGTLGTVGTRFRTKELAVGHTRNESGNGMEQCLRPAAQMHPEPKDAGRGKLWRARVKPRIYHCLSWRCRSEVNEPAFTSESVLQIAVAAGGP